VPSPFPFALPKTSGEPPTDEELLLRYCQSQDLEAFRVLMHRYDKAIYKYLLHQLRSSALAEEVFQETFLRVHEKCGAFEPSRRVRPWLYSIATHLGIDALRKEKRHRAVRLDQDHGGEQEGHLGSLRDLVVSRTPSPPEQLEVQEQAQQVWKAIDALPEELRAIVLLVYFQDLKFKEAAEILNLPLGTVKSRIHKALFMIRNSCLT
jgi:RNA polymerase sigma-70 factor, ECF subfamily